MKPQKKAVVAKKATKMPAVAKKRRTFTEKTMPDVRKEKKSKKNNKLEDPKKKIDNDKKKLEKVEERKKLDDKKKIEEKKKERLDKLEEKKKQLNKDNEKKSDKIDERKAEKRDDKTSNEEMSQENTDKKKLQKCEEKAKLEKQSVDNKKKIEKTEDKKKSVKLDDNTGMEDNVKSLSTPEDKDALENKIDILPPLKKRKENEKKKDVKLIKSDIKAISKNSIVKDKKAERKKIQSGAEGGQSQKKSVTRKTVLTKKPHLSVVKRLADKKIKLTKPVKDEEMSEDEDAVKKAKKKGNNFAKSKTLQEKKPKLAKHMKAKLPQKHSKISAVLKRED
ncbi:splicing regulatory glutamine/lysine-rich protein 1-like, partial [Temnothorax curvispinosus]|uniref:Splicing regulatory glutamine/lysine-rich protein 1-like n=1 Tax=Temnothorax curvispinosus TaxID=300111 RepID=A0A6J1PNT2_9HYME